VSRNTSPRRNSVKLIYIHRSLEKGSRLLRVRPGPMTREEHCIPHVHIDAARRCDWHNHPEYGLAAAVEYLAAIAGGFDRNTGQVHITDMSSGIQKLLIELPSTIFLPGDDGWISNRDCAIALDKFIQIIRKMPLLSSIQELRLI